MACSQLCIDCRTLKQDVKSAGVHSHLTTYNAIPGYTIYKCRNCGAYAALSEAPRRWAVFQDNR